MLNALPHTTGCWQSSPLCGSADASWKPSPRALARFELVAPHAAWEVPAAPFFDGQQVYQSMHSPFPAPSQPPMKQLNGVHLRPRRCGRLALAATSPCKATHLLPACVSWRREGGTKRLGIWR